jgi:CBS domain-containing protein
MAAPRTMQVKECMSTRPVTIHSDALVWAAVDLMRSRTVRHLPVVDRGGRLVGIVTDRDLRQVIFDPRIQERMGTTPEAVRALTVREIMTWGVITARPTTEVREAARLMHERKIGALPVVERNAVVGIVTESDLLDVLERLLRPAPSDAAPPRTPVLGPRRRPSVVRGMKSRPRDAGRYDYGVPIPALLDAWQDEGGGD